MQEQPQSTNKTRRIASNTLVLFVRMFLIMIINLYAVRVVLRGLGETDYGTYNAVAGVVLASGIITTTLAIAIQRFYSYAIGESKYDKLRDIFSASMNIIIVSSAIIVLLMETVGLWVLNSQLSIQPERMTAANWAFHLSLISFLFGLVQLPYTAAIFAHEDMGIFALISLLDCLLKLIVALLIGKSSIDTLIFYSAGLALVSCMTFLAYFLISRHRYPECQYRTIKEHSLYKQLISFSGWTMYGALAIIATTQGNTILLNVFFGAITTAAFAISCQVLHAFQSLGSSIVLAFRPPMVKAYAEKNFTFLNHLFMINNKLTIYLLIAVSVPIVTEMRTIFSWWLGEVSEESIIFARLIVIYIVCLTMNAPITIIVQASGKIRHYSLWTETIILMCLPLSFIAFKMGAPSYYALLSLILVCLSAHITRMICLRKLYHDFNIRQYTLAVIISGLSVSLFTTLIARAIHMNIANDILRFAVVFAVIPLATLLMAYFAGTSNDEKRQINATVAKYLKKKQ